MMELSTCLVSNVSPLQLPIQNNAVTDTTYGSAKGIAVGIGNPPQFFSLFPEFGDNNIWVTLADYCHGTNNYSCIAYHHGVYTPPLSINRTTIMAAWNGSQTEDSSFRNTFYNDDVQLGGRQIPGMPFISYYEEKTDWTSPAALALGADSSFINASVKVGITPNKQWSIWPGNDYLNHDGLLVLGGYDKARVSGSFTKYPFSPPDVWVNVTAMTWESGGVSTSLLPSDVQGLYGYPDPYVDYVEMPPAVLSKFLAATGTGSDGYYHSATAPSGNLTVILSDGSRTIIPTEDLFNFPQDYNDQGALQVLNYSKLLPLVQANDPQYPDEIWLGLPFMTQKLFVSDFDQGAFYMADAVKDDFGSTAGNLQPLCTGGPTSTSTSIPTGASNTTTPVTVPSAQSSGTSTAAIAGGVGGGLGALLIIGLIAFFLLRRRKKSSKADEAMQETPEISAAQYHNTPPPLYPHAFSTAPSSELGAVNYPVYPSQSTTPAPGMYRIPEQNHNNPGHDSVNQSVTVSGQDGSERHELDSDGALGPTSGPVQMPSDYDQRWTR